MRIAWVRDLVEAEKTVSSAESFARSQHEIVEYDLGELTAELPDAMLSDLQFIANRRSYALFEKLKADHAVRPFNQIHVSQYGGAAFWLACAWRCSEVFQGCELTVHPAASAQSRREEQGQWWYDLSAACESFFESEVLRMVQLPRISKTDMKSPLVSVIVPHYNLGRYLEETLGSIEAQTHRSFEIIVSDDGSNDGISSGVLGEVERAGRAKVVRGENIGLAGNRNRALKVAQGEYILPLDADDVIAPTFIEKMLLALSKAPEAAYATSWVSYFENTPTETVRLGFPWGLDRNTLPVTNVAGTCTALFRAQVLKDLGGYDETLRVFEDWELFCRLAKTGATGAIVPEPLFHYRLREGSLMSASVPAQKAERAAFLLAKHSDLALDVGRTMRLQLAESPKNLRDVDLPRRYRLADSALRQFKNARKMLSRRGGAA